VLALHGSGGLGNDNKKQIHRRNHVMVWHHGAPYLQVEPTFILAPQSMQRWAEPANTDALIRLVQRIVEQFPADKRRLYVNGYSMGGRGTICVVNKCPEMWAAAAVIAGAAYSNEVDPAALAKVPIWFFASVDDPKVPYHNEQNEGVLPTVSRIWAAKGNSGQPDETTDPDLKFTVYPESMGLGHAIDRKAVTTPGYLEFFYGRSL
jgi:predicted peptidase